MKKKTWSVYNKKTRNTYIYIKRDRNPRSWEVRDEIRRDQSGSNLLSDSSRFVLLYFTFSNFVEQFRFSCGIFVQIFWIVFFGCWKIGQWHRVWRKLGSKKYQIEKNVKFKKKILLFERKKDLFLEIGLYILKCVTIVKWLDIFKKNISFRQQKVDYLKND